MAITGFTFKMEDHQNIRALKTFNQKPIMKLVVFYVDYY